MGQCECVSVRVRVSMSVWRVRVVDLVDWLNGVTNVVNNNCLFSCYLHGPIQLDSCLTCLSVVLIASSDGVMR